MKCEMSKISVREGGRIKSVLWFLAKTESSRSFLHMVSGFTANEGVRTSQTPLELPWTHSQRGFGFPDARDTEKTRTASVRNQRASGRSSPSCQPAASNS